MNKIILIAVIVLALLSTVQAQDVVIVEMRDYQFVPAELTVKPGTTVRWVNTERRQYHNIWFKAEGKPAEHYLWPEESFERTFEQPGSYSYVCEPHEERYRMEGVIHVQAD